MFVPSRLNGSRSPRALLLLFARRRNVSQVVHLADWRAG
ncbi:hypothetical protein HMPREF0321_2267 [Dermacoccus sp. Ellin185]|nr:hypothetical protein HMPREF0321_2267 [Dermacoccus sp. Ellin185]